MRISQLVSLAGRLVVACWIAVIGGATGVNGQQTATTAETAPVDLFQDVVRFRNGDQLHGRLLGYTPNQQLLWQHKDFAQSIRFQADNVIELELKSAPAPVTNESDVFVRLTNNDVFVGRLTRLDDEITIQTAFADTIKLRRNSIRSLYPAKSSASLYFGPNNEKDWMTNIGRETWKTENNALVSSGTGLIGRAVPLPDSAQIEFDAEWNQFLNLYFACYTPINRNSIVPTGGLIMSVFNGQIRVGITSLQTGWNLGGVIVRVPELLAVSRGRFTVRVNKPQRQVVVLFNGKQVVNTSVVGDFGEIGSGLVFGSQQDASIIIRNINVTNWHMADNAVSEEAAKDDRNDTVKLVNGDVATGKIERVADGVMSIKTPQAALSIPLERILAIQFAPAGMVRARRNAGDARVWLSSQHYLTFKLENIQNGKLIGASENFGRVTCHQNAVHRIQFDIYKVDHVIRSD